ncbi:MAG: arsenic efflux protein [Endomicrobium sp.]|jgi:hypothetical protein|nr:arsenic efflux protein [Endomicrobium sp.]
MTETLLDILEHSFIDTLKLFPFLLVTYLVLEYIEHKSEGKTIEIIGTSSKIGPIIGSLLGVFPQCGFSAVAANFYAAGAITSGTLIAVFLSTSDEMLPIMISYGVGVNVFLKILAIKVFAGIVLGFIMDFVITKTSTKKEQIDIAHMCEHEGCGCHKKGILKSSLIHSVRVSIFIFFISCVIGISVHQIGLDNLKSFMHGSPIFAEMISGLVGIIPSCSASVIITQLYLDKAINLGAMLSGLLVGTGAGLLVLFRVNHDFKENLNILFILYISGVSVGVLVNLLGITI